MRYIFLFIFLIIFTGCGSSKVNIQNLQKELLESNKYLDDIANDLLDIEEIDSINERISKIYILLDNPKYQKKQNFLDVKKSLILKIKYIQRLISYGAILENSFNFVQINKDLKFYKIINIKSINNIDKELKKLADTKVINQNQERLKKHYNIILNYYKNYKYLLNRAKSLNTKSLIYNVKEERKDYFKIINIFIVISLILIIFIAVNKVNRSRVRLIFTLIMTFILFSFIAYRTIEFTYHNKVKDYKDRFLKNMLSDYSTIEEINFNMAKLIFDAYLDNDVVKNLFKQGDRKKLYKYLKDDYLKLGSKYFVSGIQFHLKDTTSFLRMHNFNIYGDKIDNTRKSVNYVNSSLKSYTGYEVGRVKGAFRNVFVLQNKDEHLGSVEVSFSINFFIQYFSKSHEEHKINFLFSGEYLLASSKNNFMTSPISDFFYDKSIIEFLKKKDISFKTKYKNRDKIKKVAAKIRVGEPFTIYFKEMKKIIAMIPIKDKFTNKVVAAVHISKNDNYIENIKKEFYTITTIVILSILILLLFIYKQVMAKYKLEVEISKALKENTKQLQVLQQQSKMAQMGEMIGAIAHQWRQPLNVISTSIQNLKYDFKDGYLNDKEYIQKFIDKNKKTVKFMSKTIDDFRSFFRVDKEKKNFNVRETTESVVAMQSAQLKVIILKFL